MAKRRANAILSIPAYPFVEAADYLNVPLSMLRASCLGQGFAAGSRTRAFRPVIRLDANDRRAIVVPQSR